jgi:hypothetical protein
VREDPGFKSIQLSKKGNIMNTLTANSTIATQAGTDFWADFIARLASWFEETPAKAAGTIPGASMTIADKAAERRFRREMAMLEGCQ